MNPPSQPTVKLKSGRGQSLAIAEALDMNILFYVREELS